MPLAAGAGARPRVVDMVSHGLLIGIAALLIPVAVAVVASGVALAR